MDAYCRDTLMSIGKHYETGESIPDDIYKKLLAARTFRAGSLSLRQVGKLFMVDAFRSSFKGFT